MEGNWTESTAVPDGPMHWEQLKARGHQGKLKDSAGDKAQARLLEGGIQPRLLWPAVIIPLILSNYSQLVQKLPRGSLEVSSSWRNWCS